MQATVEQSTYLLALAEPVLTQLDDSHRALEPMPGTKTAGWLVGHLAVSGDFARRLCGRPTLCPGAWRRLFNPGSHPSVEPNTYPSMATLCDIFRRVDADVCLVGQLADPTALSAL